MAIGPTNVGGVGLNLKVVAYPSLDVLPEKAQENTIAIITECPLAQWDISQSQPADMQEGDVWLPILPSKVIIQPAKRKNLFFSLTKAKQVCEGKLISREIRVFQQGVWNSAYSLLYDAGDINEAFTGGFSEDGANLTIDSTQFKVSGKFSSAGYRGAITRNVISLDPFEKLRIYVESYSDASPAVFIGEEKTTLSRGWNTVDVSTFKDARQIRIAVFGTNSVTITNNSDFPGIYLE